MRKILCSTGALFPRTTPEKYIALGDMADKSVSVALRLASSSRGLGHLPNKQKNAPGIYRCTACQFVK